MTRAIVAEPQPTTAPIPALATGMAGGAFARTLASQAANGPMGQPDHAVPDHAVPDHAVPPGAPARATRAAGLRTSTVAGPVARLIGVPRLLDGTSVPAANQVVAGSGTVVPQPDPSTDPAAAPAVPVNQVAPIADTLLSRAEDSAPPHSRPARNAPAQGRHEPTTTPEPVAPVPNEPRAGPPPLVFLDTVSGPVQHDLELPGNEAEPSAAAPNAIQAFPAKSQTGGSITALPAPPGWRMDPSSNAATALADPAPDAAASGAPGPAPPRPGRSGAIHVRIDVQSAQPVSAPAPDAAAQALDAPSTAEPAATDASDLAMHPVSVGVRDGAANVATPLTTADPAPLAAIAAATLPLQAAAAHDTPAAQVAAALAPALMPALIPALIPALARPTPVGEPRILTVQLNPDELGRVSIRIDQGADGPARVDLTAERPETLHLLLRDQPALHRALDAAGIAAEARLIRFHLADPSAAAIPGTPAALPDPPSGTATGASSGAFSGNTSGQHLGQSPDQGAGQPTYAPRPAPDAARDTLAFATAGPAPAYAGRGRIDITA